VETDGKFYLGRLFDSKTSKATDQPLLYDPEDLTTHAVVVGMTGSGKTGLCIDLLEEAALSGVPALMIDPKGDITNLLLHFPDLAPEDFTPWVNPDQARKEGKTLEQAGADTAALWQKGLADWGIPSERIRILRESAHFAVYTPGSDAGIPVSILASLKAPPIPWESNRELLREKISGTVTALLGLVGLTDIDPVRSREHILLSNIFEYAWSREKDLDLGELILQTQTPPFSKLGVLDVNTFFPEKDRFSLAMLLNNILAAPSFQTWIEGHPLDIPSLLYGEDNRPRHCVFYIAHLSDAERMFFVTLLYSAVEAWMRTQPGTPSLRAILYFDEIFGYMPPIGNPPSKQPMLRMLKQARAFGVGQVLVTQNPVDLDYKGLSNTGTWFIGKLQTDRDKQRLLDGLESATASQAAGGMDRNAYDRMISALGKRVFLMHNVHAKGPALFQTRWAMNYLAGPLTRAQIPALAQLVQGEVEAALIEEDTAATIPAAKETPTRPRGVAATAVTGAATLQASKSDRAESGFSTRPTVPGGISECFLPNNLTFTQSLQAVCEAQGKPYPQQATTSGLLYRPVILAQASVRFLNRKYNLDTEMFLTSMVPDPDPRGVVRWEDYQGTSVAGRSVDEQPAPEARFAALESPLNDARILTALRRDFTDWAYREAKTTVRANEKLGVYAGPDVSQADFRKQCSEAAREGRDTEAKKVEAAYETKIENLQERLQREQRELDQDEAELSNRKMEEIGTHAETLLGLFGKRKRRLSSSLSKRRMTSQAGAKVQESKEAIKDFQTQIAELEQERDQALEEVNRKWSEIADDEVEITVTPLKKDILLDIFSVAWVPHYLAQVGDEILELPGYNRN